MGERSIDVVKEGLIEDMTVEKLIEDGITINYRSISGGPWNLIEIYRDNFVYITNGEEDSVITKDIVLNYWSEEEAKRLEVVKAKSGEPDIKKYFDTYGLMNNLRVTNRDEQYSGSYNSRLYYGGKPTPDGIWNSELLYRDIYINAKNDDNNYYNKYGRVGKIHFDLKNESEWCIDCSVKNGKPSIRSSHGWYDDLPSKCVQQFTFEEWKQQLDDGFDFLWDSIELELSKNSDITKPYKTTGDKLFQDNPKYIFVNYGSTFYTCEVLSTGKYRTPDLKTLVVPKRTTGTKTIDDIKAEVKNTYYTMITNTGFTHPHKWK